MKIPQKVADRIASGLRRFQPILQAAHARDINESDTPDARIEAEEICAVLTNEVLKREVLEGDRAAAAKRLVARAAGRALRKAHTPNVPQPTPAADVLPTTT